MSDSSNLHPADEVDLAHEPAFDLGGVEVRPALRQLRRRGDGAEEVVEPRIMQVLVALARAQGGIVTRDELIERCWRGRIVGDDALNRAISRVRRLAEGIGSGSFRLDTVTRVGYRLVAEGGGYQAVPPGSPPAPGRPPSNALLTRRTVAATLVVAALGGGGFLLLRDAGEPEPGDPRLLDLAWQAWTQGTSEGNRQAIGLYRRATEQAPGHADAWGFLGCAYADRAQVWATAAEQPGLRERAREAGRQALRLDSRNAYGRAAIAYAQPVRGNWAVMEREFRRALQDQPGKWLVTYSLALLFTHVGRMSEAARLFGSLGDEAPTATQYFFHVRALWGSGRIGEAERLLGQAAAIYADHPMVWQTRFDLLMHGDGPVAAIAFAQDAAARTREPRDEWKERRVAVAREVLRGNREGSEPVATELMQEAREAAWRSPRPIQDLALLGRLDEAFAVADAYYFSRGFAIPDQPSATGEPATVTLDARQTGFLFLPPLRPMRADPRFAQLVDRLGLQHYWRSSGSRPDYLV